MTTPAGWYDDGSGRQRWWDGAAWTEHTVETQQAPPATFAPPYELHVRAAPTYAAPGMSPVSAAAPAATRKVPVVGVIGLAAAGLGLVVACVPPIAVAGWVLLGAGFVTSVVSLFLRGAKWPGGVGTGVSVLGSILALAVGLLTVGAASTASSAGDAPPVATPSAPSSDGEHASPPEGAETVAFADLEVGQCIPYLDWSEELYEVPVVPCDQPHTDEVYSIFDAPDGEFPGDDELQTLASDRCLVDFEDFVGFGYAESELDYYWSVPTKATWTRWNDREVLCIVFSYEDVTGTLEGAKR